MWPGIDLTAGLICGQELYWQLDLRVARNRLLVGLFVGYFTCSMGSCGKSWEQNWGRIFNLVNQNGLK